jgi:hypothetical protein
VPALVTPRAVAFHLKEIIARQLMEISIATAVQFAISIVTVVKMSTVLQVIVLACALM